MASNGTVFFSTTYKSIFGHIYTNRMLQDTKLNGAYGKYLDDIVGGCAYGVDIFLTEDLHETGAVCLQDPLLNALELTLVRDHHTLLVVCRWQVHVHLTQSHDTSCYSWHLTQPYVVMLLITPDSHKTCHVTYDTTQECLPLGTFRTIQLNINFSFTMTVP